MEFRGEGMPALTWMQGLHGDGEGEVHELATTRSVRSLERGGGDGEVSSAG